MSTRLKSKSRVAIKKCRLCLCKTETFINLFQGSFVQKILDLTSLKISEEDGFPRIACIECIVKVQQAHRTRNKILECNSKLQEGNCMELEPSLENSILNTSIMNSDYFTDNLKDVDEINQVSSLKLEEFAAEEGDKHRLEDFDVKPNIIAEDITYVYHNVNEAEERTFTKELIDTEVGSDEISINSQLEMFNKKSKIKFQTKKIFGVDVKKKNVCGECNLEFRNRLAYRRHMLKHLKSQCKICGVSIRRDNLSKHIGSHTSGPRICDLCGATCKNIESLRGHIYHVHKKRTDEYKCDQCNKSFRMQCMLDLHKKKVHIGLRNHICKTCNKGFFTFCDMNHHVKMTHLKLRPHVCPHCERGFSSKHALKTHERQHTNETPYKCYVCAEGFRQNVSLRTHLKSKHNIEEVKNIPCEFCDKAFSTDFALKVHLRLHGYDNYKCEHCEDSFQQKIFLINHLSTVHQIIETIDTPNDEQQLDEDDDLE